MWLGISASRSGLVLAIVVTCQLMIVLDNTVVNLALPSIRTDLGFSATGLAWVSNAYILTFGGLLLLGGRLGDVLGRRRVFATGVSLFTVSSLVGGAASSDTVLVAARAIQGVGAAIAAPSALAILLATFAEGPARNRALGLFFAMSAAGGAIGLMVGGAFTSWLSWRWVLWINVPLGLVIVAVTFFVIQETERIPRRFDTAGTVTSMVAVASLVYGFIRAGEQGWGDAAAIVAFLVATVLTGVFVAIERRTEHPLLPLRLFERRVTACAYLTMLLIPGVMVGMYFFTAQFMQVVLGYSAIETGLAFLPMSLLIFTASRTVPVLLARFGPRPFMITGAVSLTVAMLWLTQLSASSAYVTSLAPALVLFGLGGGLLYMPLSAVLLSGVRSEDSGAASGAMQAVQQIGAALGIAVLVSVFGSSLRGTGEITPVAFADAVSNAFVVGAGLAGLVLALILIAVRPERTQRAVTKAPAMGTTPAD